MAKPKHKAKEKKPKTVFDRLKDSALFVLFIIALFIVDIVAFIYWLSGVLSSRLSWPGMLKDSSFYIFGGLAVLLAVFFGIATLVQRRVHGKPTP